MHSSHDYNRTGCCILPGSHRPSCTRVKCVLQQHPPPASNTALANSVVHLVANVTEFANHTLPVLFVIRFIIAPGIAGGDDIIKVALIAAEPLGGQWPGVVAEAGEFSVAEDAGFGGGGGGVHRDGGAVYLEC